MPRSPASATRSMPPVTTLSGDLDPAHPIFHDPALGEVRVVTTAAGRGRLAERLSILGLTVGEAPSDQGPVGASDQGGRYEVYRVGSGGSATHDEAAQCNNDDVSHGTELTWSNMSAQTPPGDITPPY